MSMDDNDGQMIFGDLGGLKLPDICLTGEEKPRKTSPRKLVPTGDRIRARCVTSAHATTCSTARCSGGQHYLESDTIAYFICCCAMELPTWNFKLYEHIIYRNKSSHDNCTMIYFKLNIPVAGQNHSIIKPKIWKENIKFYLNLKFLKNEIKPIKKPKRPKKDQ